MRFTRRTFLQVLGGTAGAAVVAKGQISSKVGAAAEDIERWAKPEEVMVPSICQQCPGGCGLMVRTLDGQVSGIAGNREHPINRGSLCPKAFGALQLLYDPNRLKGPLARAGERGQGKWKPITWDEAIAKVTTSPACGGEDIRVVEAWLSATGERVKMDARLCHDGFELPDWTLDREDGSTEDETAVREACGQRGDLAFFGFGLEGLPVVWIDPRSVASGASSDGAVTRNRSVGEALIGASGAQR